MPVLGVIFLRHASNRYEAALGQIKADQAAGRMPNRPLVKADFIKRRALMLPEGGPLRLSCASSPGYDRGKALMEAMNAIEASSSRWPASQGIRQVRGRAAGRPAAHLRPRALRTASGDMFGRIYEYFLMKFAMQGAQDNGEFFTPPSLVQTIVNVIEPDHGIVLDPACGSGGMFVQSSHFIERAGRTPPTGSPSTGRKRPAPPSAWPR